MELLKAADTDGSGEINYTGKLLYKMRCNLRSPKFKYGLMASLI